MSTEVSDWFSGEDRILQLFAALPLTVRMRAAAHVVAVATVREGTGFSWSPQDLREFADRWEHEDAKEKDVEELSKDIHAFSLGDPNGYRDLARTLIKAGWTKVAHDE